MKDVKGGADGELRQWILAQGKKRPSVIERLDWLLKEFLQRPDAELRGLSREAAERFFNEMVRRFISAASIKGLSATFSAGTAPITGLELADLAAETLRGIEEVVRGRACPVGCPEEGPKGSHAHGFWRAGLSAADEGANYIVFGAGFRNFGYGLSGVRNTFLVSLATALAQEGTRIARCARESCGRLFVRRKRGKFCSPACLNQEKLDRFIASKGGPEGYSEYRHEKYEESARKAAGNGKSKSLRVPRRKRRLSTTGGSTDGK